MKVPHPQSLLDCPEPRLDSQGFPNTPQRAQTWPLPMVCHSHVPADLVEYAAGAPQVHLVRVEAICEQTLGGAVPARGDILGVRLL